MVILINCPVLNSFFCYSQPEKEVHISLDTTSYRDVPIGTPLKSSSELGEIKDAFLLLAVMDSLQFWSCFGNWNTAFKYSHRIYTHDQHRWLWLIETVHHSQKVYILMRFIGEEIWFDATIRHIISLTIKLWKTFLWIYLCN